MTSEHCVATQEWPVLDAPLELRMAFNGTPVKRCGFDPGSLPVMTSTSSAHWTWRRPLLKALSDIFYQQGKMHCYHSLP